MKVIRVIIFLATLNVSFDLFAQARRPPPPRRPELERRNREVERVRKTEEAKRAEATKHTVVEARPIEQRLQARILESISDLVAAAPKARAVGRWGERLLQMERELTDSGLRPTRGEVDRWIRKNVGERGTLSENSFRGALFEASSLVALARSGYREIRWDSVVREVKPVAGDGTPIKLEARRFDLVARNPEGETVALEVKAADLAKALTKSEVDVLGRARNAYELMDHIQHVRAEGRETSRVFSELARDAWMSREQGIKIEWLVENAPRNFSYDLGRYGVRVHLLQ